MHPYHPCELTRTVKSTKQATTTRKCYGNMLKLFDPDTSHHHIQLEHRSCSSSYFRCRNLCAVQWQGKAADANTTTGDETSQVELIDTCSPIDAGTAPEAKGMVRYLLVSKKEELHRTTRLSNDRVLVPRPKRTTFRPDTVERHVGCHQTAQKAHGATHLNTGLPTQSLGQRWPCQHGTSSCSEGDQSSAPGDEVVPVGVFQSSNSAATVLITISTWRFWE